MKGLIKLQKQEITFGGNIMFRKNDPFKFVITFIFVIFLMPISNVSAEEIQFDPFEKSIDEISAALDNNEITSEELVHYYLERIEAYDKKGPTINAITTLNSQALETAKKLDAERKSKGPRSKLHGIPIVVKDNYDVKGLPNTAGSVALKNTYPTQDAFTIKKLTDAGAIIIAKANLSELAASYGRLGYSSLGGLTLNPYNLNRDASGSSSGTAAAVAANFAVFGLGTDTSGSIRGPSNVAGLVGIRPTLGLTSRSGVIPSSLAFDTTGPMARTVTDTAIALSFMAGVDRNDPQTMKSAGHIIEDYSADLNKDALQDARVGVVRDFFGDNAEVDSINNKALETMEELGAEVVPVSFSEKTQYLWTPVIGPINSADFKSQFEEYLSRLPEGQPKTLEEVIKIMESPEVVNSETPVNPARLEGLKEDLAQAVFKDTPEYNNILMKEIPEVRNEIQTILKENNLDAIVFPTLSCPASPRYDKEDPTYVCEAYDTYAAGYIASATGFPEITVPAGATKEDLPVGISFLSSAYSEQTLFDLAYSFEQATKARTIPETTPNFQVDTETEFKDVISFKDEIHFLASRRIIKGHEGGDFKPQDSITRLEVVQMILREKGIVNFNHVPNPGFLDIQPEDYGYAEVAKAVELGFISGKTNSQGQKTFDPNGQLTRAQAAKMLALAYNLKGNYPTEFSDVPKKHWAHNYVSSLAANRITAGYKDGSFKPGANLTREHFAALMARQLDDAFKPSM